VIKLALASRVFLVVVPLALTPAAACAQAPVVPPDIIAPAFMTETWDGSPRIDTVPAPPRPARAPAPAPVKVARRRPTTPAAGADRACLADLAALSVPYVNARPVRGVQTPVEIVGPIAGVGLVPRAARLPLMDCALARTLAGVVPVFRRQGVIGLVFSGAYDYRNRRGSPQLSAHAHGLAIDVHAVSTRNGRLLDVTEDWPRLRTLATRLRAHPAVRYVITPDDNSDHHDHLHIEAYPGGQVLSAAAPASTQARRARARRR
jgi:hypothetical protein